MSQIMKVKPQSLLTIARLDLIIKKLYFDVMSGKRTLQKELIERLYGKHILKRTRGIEPVDQYQNKKSSKSTFNCYVSEAHKLKISFDFHGYIEKYPVPVSRKGLLLNGAHRIGLSLSVGLDQLPIDLVSDGCAWDLNWFKKNFTAFEWLFLIKEYCLYKNNSSPFIIWGAIHESWHDVIDTVRQDFLVQKIYTLDFDNNFDGFFFFVHAIYSSDEFSDATIRRKAAILYAISPKICVCIAEDPAFKDGEDFFIRLNRCKKNIREKFSNHVGEEVYMTLHMPSDKEEKTSLTNLLLNKNRLRIYRLMSRGQMPSIFYDWIEELKEVCKIHKIDTNRICLTGSVSYALLGVRDATDIDFTVCSDTRKNFSADCHSLSKNIDIVTKTYARNKRGLEWWTSDNELIFCPEHHFLFNGLKICNPEIVFSRKNYSKRDKDIRDFYNVKEFLFEAKRKEKSFLKKAEFLLVEKNIRELM